MAVSEALVRTGSVRGIYDRGCPVSTSSLIPIISYPPEHVQGALIDDLFFDVSLPELEIVS